MIPLLLHLALGTLIFWAQETPGVRIGPPRLLGGEASLNFRLADFDRDGAKDILLPEGVLFQRDGGYSGAIVLLPASSGLRQLDLWEECLFIRTHGGLSINEWKEDAWHVRLEQKMDWPVTPSQSALQGREHTHRNESVLDRFLHDVDNDGKPEIAVVGEESVYLFRRTDTHYVLAAQWPVLPPLTLLRQSGQRVWPPADRALTFPARHMSCQVVFEEGALSIITRQDLFDTAARAGDGPGALYTSIRYPVQGKEAYALGFDAAQEQKTGVLPRFLKPCRLNGDQTLDYAGGRCVASGIAPLPKFIYETWATLDNGESFHVRRAPMWPGAQPNCSFLDIDNDGAQDMVIERCRMYEQGTRELVNRFLFSSAVEVEVQVFRQAAGTFAQSPTLKHSVRLDIEQAPIRGGLAFQRFLAGELISLAGDYNGDGYRDLAVRRTPRELAVYLSNTLGFSRTPSGLLEIDPAAYVSFADVNGDGKTDIAVRATVQEGQKKIERTLVHFVREEAP